jgi:hypothetical protein
MVVFNDVLISALFNCIRVIWHLTCFVWDISYFTVVNHEPANKKD